MCVKMSAKQKELAVTEVGFEPTPEDWCLKPAPQTTRPSSHCCDVTEKNSRAVHGYAVKRCLLLFDLIELVGRVSNYGKSDLVSCEIAAL